MRSALFKNWLIGVKIALKRPMMRSGFRAQIFPNGVGQSFRHPEGVCQRRPSPMSKPRKKKRSPKRVLALPDLEQAKTAVLNTLTSKSGQRSYDRAITDSSIGTVQS